MPTAPASRHTVVFIPKPASRGDTVMFHQQGSDVPAVWASSTISLPLTACPPPAGNTKVPYRFLVSSVLLVQDEVMLRFVPSDAVQSFQDRFVPGPWAVAAPAVRGRRTAVSRSVFFMCSRS